MGYLYRILQALERRSKPQIAALSLLALLFFGVIDYATGPDLAVFIFYLLPVFLATWFLGNPAGIAFSLLSALTWSVADILSARAYSFAIIPTWNLFTELAFFLIAVFILSALKASLEQEKQSARTDFLTGAFNSRYFAEVAKTEISRYHRYGHPFIMAYLDVDDFKSVNDRFGHAAGNEVLTMIVKTIRDHVRATDIIARVGGDEFVLLLPETVHETGRAAVEKVRAKLAEAMRERNLPVTFSIGVALFDRPPASVDEMIAVTDRLMYEVKRTGKNGVRYVRTGNGTQNG